MWISIPGFLLLYFTLSYLPLPEWLRASLAFLPPFVCLTRLQHYKCPRCDNPFFYDGGWNPWRKNCVHCGQPKWEEGDYVDPDPPQPPDGTPSIAEMAANASISARERDSRFLTLVLRDDPGAIHLKLDSEGWADADNLLTRANRYGFKLTRKAIEDAMAADGNPCFEWNQATGRIRACQAASPRTNDFGCRPESA